jgi:hypothetical protein
MEVLVLNFYTQKIHKTDIADLVLKNLLKGIFSLCLKLIDDWEMWCGHFLRGYFY